MKEDILEQLVDDYLKFNGFFTVHNIKFRPATTDLEYISKSDRNHSDVDLIGFNPLRKGTGRVWVVSCKSWQVGFNPRRLITAIEGKKVIGGRQAWRLFRELAIGKWVEALFKVIKELTGSDQFTYITAVTKLTGERTLWEDYPLFKKNLRGNPIKILTLNEILDDLYKKKTTTPASSDIGRLLQLVRASEWLDSKH